MTDITISLDDTTTERDAATLAALMELSGVIAMISMDLGVELPTTGEDVEDLAGYVDGLTLALSHIHGQLTDDPMEWVEH